jgi:hypothetical protein
MTSNVGEYGQILRASIGQDVSTNVGLTFTIQPQVGPQITRSQSEGVSVGTADITIGDIKYLANEHLEYIVKDGDLDKAGNWRKKAGASLSSTVEVVGDYEIFSVLA